MKKREEVEKTVCIMQRENSRTKDVIGWLVYVLENGLSKS